MKWRAGQINWIVLWSVREKIANYWARSQLTCWLCSQSHIWNASTTHNKVWKQIFDVGSRLVPLWPHLFFCGWSELEAWVLTCLLYWRWHVKVGNITESICSFSKRVRQTLFNVCDVWFKAVQCHHYLLISWFLFLQKRFSLQLIEEKLFYVINISIDSLFVFKFVLCFLRLFRCDT